MKSRSARTLVWFIAIGSMALVAFFLLRTAQEETSEKRRAREEGYLREWVACEFVDIDEAFESEVLPQIPKTVSPGIGAEQEAAAMEAAAGFVRAFSSGRFADFKAFRMPAKYSLSQSNIIFYRSVMSKISPKESAEKPALKAPALPDWAVLGEPRDHPPPLQLPLNKRELESGNIMATIHKLASQGTGYKRYFDGICMKQSRLTLLSTNRLIGPLWKQILDNAANIGIVDAGGGARLVRFERTPQEVLAESGEIAYLTVKLHVRLAHPDPVKPIYCRWFWEPLEAKWLPMDLTAASMQKRSKINLTFL